MEERVIKAIRVICKEAIEITSETNLTDDLGFSSLDIIMLVCELEAEFNQNFDEGDFADILTVGDIITKMNGVVSNDEFR